MLNRFKFIVLTLCAFCVVAAYGKAKIVYDYDSDSQVGYDSFGENRLNFYSLFRQTYKYSTQSGFMSSKPSYFLYLDPQAKIEYNNDSGLEKREIFYQGGIAVGMTDSIDIFIGRKIVIWGRADEYNPVDHINAENFESFLVYRKERRKIPRDLVKLSWNNSYFRIKLLALKGNADHRFLGRNEDACKGDCQRFSIDNAVDAYKALGLPVRVEENSSKQSSAHEYAMKIEPKFHGFDLGIYGFYMGSKIPVYQQSISQQTGVEFFRIYPRSVIYGLDSSFIAGKYGLRGEMVYRSKQHYLIDPTTQLFQEDGDKLKKKDEAEIIVGVDRTFFSQLYVNMQVSHRKVLPDSEELLVFSGGELFTLLIRDQFLDEDLQVELRLIEDTKKGSVLYQPEIKYSIDEHYSIFSKASLFDGKKNTFFGDYMNLSQYSIGMSAIF